MIDWQDLHHSDLSVSQLYTLLQLRYTVSAVEQNCSYQDIDGNDLEGEDRHIPGWYDGALVAHARVLKSGGELQPVVTSRMIINEALRGEKIGRQLMNKVLESCTRRWPEKPIYLGAQTHLQNFYGQFGFIPVTDIHEEDDIPHIGMARKVIQA